MPIQPGTKAPDFTLRTMTADGIVDFALADHIGKSNLVLLFFPGAFTGVCTQELCDVTAGLGSYKSLNAEVIGISVDSVFAQNAWAQANGTSIPLVSDYERVVSTAYDVIVPNFGGMGRSSARAVFVIDKEGVIRYAAQTPTPGDMPDFEPVKKVLAELG